MGLPRVKMPTSTVDIDGEEVVVFGLSREDIHEMSKLDPADAEVYMISRGCRVDLDEAKAWFSASPIHVVDVVLEKVQELSYLDPKDPAESNVHLLKAT